MPPSPTSTTSASAGRRRSAPPTSPSRNHLTERNKGNAMADKVALVTGAGTGVGRAASLALARSGYAIVLVGRRREPLDAVAEAAKAAGARTLAVPTNVGDPKSVAELFAKVKATFGRLDVLFN